ncbi:MAG: sodium:solute symporter [Flavobacteriaceae bacterium]|nr:sodium:solute symporter [Flavobacteriaceae bacterium]
MGKVFLSLPFCLFMQSPEIILSLIIGYFIILIAISKYTSYKASNSTFFNANKNAPWYLVAYGMVGASLSGVTFISVPGWVESSQLTYFQVVIGYLIGYFVVAFVLLPIYYKNNVTSIYEYLNIRFGPNTQKTGAFFFFISRVLGAAFRLFLVALVLYQYIFKIWGVPFEVSVILSILLIWIYTRRGGINTIIWTDTLQTTLMILSVILSISYILNELNLDLITFIESDSFKSMNKLWVIDNFNERNYFLKSIIGGAFITICMTGLDQDMMQKNLTCKDLYSAQKNMVTFSFVLVFVTFLFLILGILLYTYSYEMGINIPQFEGKESTDLIFPEIALNHNLGTAVGVTFILGLVAAAYSSADSALTSLTTSLCIDFINIDQYKPEVQKSIRINAHIGMSLLLIIVVIIFKHVLDRNVIDSLLTVASYTYGPLLGIFALGIFTNYKIDDRKVLWISLMSVFIISIPKLLFYLDWVSSENLWGYKIGYELLPLNGLITFVGLILIGRKQNQGT